MIRRFDAKRGQSLKKLYFHVGSGRCGSTLIQALFNDKMFHGIFADHSRSYDPQIYISTGTIAHEDSFVEDSWRPIREKFIAPMANAASEGFFITQENLLGMRSDKDKKNICEVSCEKVAYLSEGHEPHIIIVIRRQDTYIESLYNQRLKRWEKRDFETFVAEFPRDNWHWLENIDIYSNHFGRENVTVVPFEGKVYGDSGLTGFLDGVLKAMGVTTRFAFNDLPVMNASLAPRVLEIQRIANNQLNQNEAHALADWFGENIAKKPDDPHKLMTDDIRRELIEFYRESNLALCDKYFADFPNAKAYYTGEDI